MERSFVSGGVAAVPDAAWDIMALLGDSFCRGSRSVRSADKV
jgi:hypothetical protein